MRRISVAQRSGLKETAWEHGYEYRAGVGVPYWDETAITTLPYVKSRWI